MKSTHVDGDGNVVCPVCGAKNQFKSKRTALGKVAGGVLLAPKRLKCNGCGTNLKRGDAPRRPTIPTIGHGPSCVCADCCAARLARRRR